MNVLSAIKQSAGKKQGIKRMGQPMVLRACVY